MDAAFARPLRREGASGGVRFSGDRGRPGTGALGAELTSVQLRARNTAPESANLIHSDAEARRYGFRGGLVPGVTTYSYLTRPVVERWGRSWLERGGLSVRLVSPVYDGEEVTAALAESGEVVLRGGAGQVCAEGVAVALAEPPVGSPPDGLEPVSVELSEEAAQAHLAEVGETLPIYPAERLAHPGWLLSLANEALILNLRPRTPWIHVQSDIRNLAAVHWGERVEVRGRVAELYERRGHRFCDLDLVLLAGGRPRARVLHRAIYELRPPA